MHPEAATKEIRRPKKTMCEDKFFWNQPVWARNAREKKKAYICLEMGIVARRRRAFLFFGTDLAGPVRQEDVSETKFLQILGFSAPPPRPAGSL